MLVFLHPLPPSIAAPAAGGLCLQPTTISLRSSPYPPRSARAPQKPLLPRRPSPSRLLQGVLHRGLTRSTPTGPTASTHASPGSPAAPTVKPSSDRIFTRTRQRTTAAGAAPPAVDYGCGPGGAPRPSARRANTPPRFPRPRPGPPTAATPAPAASSVPTVPIPSDRVGAEPVGTPLLRLTPPLGDTPPAPANLDALGDAAKLQFDDSVARFFTCRLGATTAG